MQNLNNMKLRAAFANNDRQHERMIQDKLKSFHRALLYSYQAAWIHKEGTDIGYVRALINPDKIKFDYDEKIVSVDFSDKFKPGDVFEWPKGSKIRWIIYKQELSELAYFRGNIRRCQLIEAVDPETKEKVKIWAAIRGPVETTINTIQKAGLVADVPNWSLDIYMPNTEQNHKIFCRYYRFQFMEKIWKVQVQDNISTPGIIEVVAMEDYDCKSDEPLIKVVDPNPEQEPEEYQIIGNTFIKPLTKQNYTVIGPPNLKWSITLPASNNKEIKDVLKYNVLEDGSIDVTWTAMISGSYILHYGMLEKTIVVESLF